MAERRRKGGPLLGARRIHASGRAVRRTGRDCARRARGRVARHSPLRRARRGTSRGRTPRNMSIGVGTVSITPRRGAAGPGASWRTKLSGTRRSACERATTLRVLVENHLPDSPTSSTGTACWTRPRWMACPTCRTRRSHRDERTSTNTRSGRAVRTGTTPMSASRSSGAATAPSSSSRPMNRGTTGQDVVVLLGDWLHRSPEEVFAELRAGKEQQRWDEAPAGARLRAGTNPRRRQQGGMKMPAGGADFADVNYDAFLLNGRGPADPWTLRCARRAGAVASDRRRLLDLLPRAPRRAPPADHACGRSGRASQSRSTIC